MDHHRIYLSGPISGFTFAEATAWRNEAYDILSDFAEVLDPMRGKQAPDEQEVDAESCDADDPQLLTDRGIVTRDYFDTRTSTILFVNLLGSRKASIGTIAEIAWAYMLRIPTIIVMENQGNPHEHGFIREMAGFRVDTVERGIEIAKSVMGIPKMDPALDWPSGIY